MDLVTPQGLTIPESLLSWRFSRSSGPGGQSVNTANSRAELILDLTSPAAVLALDPAVLDRLRSRLGDAPTTSSQTERSQLQNRALARARLALLLDSALKEEKPRKKRGIPRAVKERRLEEKRRRSEAKRLRSQRF